MKQKHKYIGLDVHKDQNQDEKSPWGPRPSSGSLSPGAGRRRRGAARSGPGADGRGEGPAGGPVSIEGVSVAARLQVLGPVELDAGAHALPAGVGAARGGAQDRAGRISAGDHAGERT